MTEPITPDPLGGALVELLSTLVLFVGSITLLVAAAMILKMAYYAYNQVLRFFAGTFGFAATVLALSRVAAPTWPSIGEIAICMGTGLVMATLFLCGLCVQRFTARGKD